MNSNHRLACAAWLLASGIAAAQPCPPSWASGVSPVPGLVGHDVFALAPFDDGTGPAMYAAGDFDLAGGVQALNVARWDGHTWGRLANGTNGAVRALAVFDDGTGPALYAGGDFTRAGGATARSLAKWNGSRWTEVGGGTDGSVAALRVFDDGHGPALYVGGHFAHAGGVAAASIARWNGAAWSALGSGTNGRVNALATYGGRLHAGGEFSMAGGVPAAHVARFTGTAWQPLGAGTDDVVHAMTTFDNGAGTKLWVGGAFAHAGGEFNSLVAQWNGTSWVPPSGLLTGVGTVRALASFDSGSGPRLYAGGRWEFGCGPDGTGTCASTVAVLRPGGNWVNVFGFVSSVVGFTGALASFDDGSGRRLYAGAGNFGESGIVSLFEPGVARYDGTNWFSFGGSYTNRIWNVSAFDDGSGQAIYVGGSFAAAADPSVVALARFEAGTFSPVGSGLATSAGQGPPVVSAMSRGDDGSGPALFVGGFFSTAGGQPARNVAKWNGTAWSGFGAGLAWSPACLATFDDGTGLAVYAGGSAGIFRWNGSTWSPVGSGFLSQTVQALAVFDDGTGPALYAGGSFGVSDPNGQTLGIARWNGSSWSGVGGGMGVLPTVHTLAVFDDGSGSALYAGGQFSTAGGVGARHLAKWNGSSWSALGAGLAGGTTERALTLTVFDDGSGSALYVGGEFESADGVSGTSGVARWNGSSFGSVGSGVQGVVAGMVGADDGRGLALHLVGGFTVAGSTPSFGIARWQALAPSVRLQPALRHVSEGGAIRFDAEPFGSSPMTFQWRKSGMPILGATTRSLRIDHARFSDAADYDVVATNGCGSGPSNPATLVVDPFFSIRAGNVNAGAGPVTNVLFVNGSAGAGEERLVTIGPITPFQLRLSAPPSNPSGPAGAAIFAWAGRPTSSTVQTLPSGIGLIAMPSPAGAGVPQPVRIANSTGDALWGTEIWPGPPTQPAPTMLVNAPGGVRRTGDFYFQGILFDSAAPNGSIAVTNGIRVVSR